MTSLIDGGTAGAVAPVIPIRDLTGEETTIHAAVVPPEGSDVLTLGDLPLWAQGVWAPGAMDTPLPGMEALALTAGPEAAATASVALGDLLAAVCGELGSAAHVRLDVGTAARVTPAVADALADALVPLLAEAVAREPLAGQAALARYAPGGAECRRRATALGTVEPVPANSRGPVTAPVTVTLAPDADGVYLTVATRAPFAPAGTGQPIDDDAAAGLERCGVGWGRRQDSTGARIWLRLEADHLVGAGHTAPADGPGASPTPPGPDGRADGLADGLADGWVAAPQGGWDAASPEGWVACAWSEPVPAEAFPAAPRPIPGGPAGGLVTLAEHPATAPLTAVPATL
jgi:hypothetical protein